MTAPRAPKRPAPVCRKASGQVCGGLLLLAAAARLAGAQIAAPAGAAAGDRPPADAAATAALAGGSGTGLTPDARIRRERHAPWWAPVASALAPGAGQAALGQDRWLAFAAFETTALLRYAADRREGQGERRAYRRLANQVARALYTTGTPPAGGFEYYETMEKWIESGVYDARPGGAVDPETDAGTFNGSIWLLARQTYWSDPESPPVLESSAYRNAIAFYERRAIRPEYRWSWRNAQLEQDLYRRAIARSNDAFQRAAQDLAAVLANHVLSTVDAYVTVRLRRRPGPAGDEAELGAEVPWPRRGHGG